jgi:hypothetical protein
VYTRDLASTCFLYKSKILLPYRFAERPLGDDVRDDVEGAVDLIDCLPLEISTPSTILSCDLSGVADVRDRMRPNVSNSMTSSSSEI